MQAEKKHHHCAKNKTVKFQKCNKSSRPQAKCTKKKHHASLHIPRKQNDRLTKLWLKALRLESDDDFLKLRIFSGISGLPSCRVPHRAPFSRRCSETSANSGNWLQGAERGRDVLSGYCVMLVYARAVFVFGEQFRNLLCSVTRARGNCFPSAEFRGGKCLLGNRGKIVLWWDLLG